jgi:ubiquinone/menaquinone biosynthesis C-methylase UbiE
MWDLVAPVYAAEVVPTFETFVRKALELAEVAPEARVVDVACGPGTLSVHAARSGHPVQAIDYSPQMIEQLRAMNEPNITAQVGDGQALPYDDAAFGGGFSLFGLMFFDDRAKGFEELRRVLEPKAKAVVTSWVSLDDAPIMSALFGAMRDAIAKEGLHGAMPEMKQPGLSTVDDFYREMSLSFREVEITHQTHEVLVPSVEELAAGLLRTLAPVVVLRNAIGHERFKPIDTAMTDAIARTVGKDQPKLILRALFGVGSA